MSDVSCLVNYKIQKMKKLRLFFVTLFFVLTNISSLYSATTYPIQLTAQLLPPYGNRLSDYVVDGMERINITALQRDLSWNRYEFYLQMQVKRGSNILLRASAQYQVTPGFVTQLSANALFSRLAEVVVSNPRLQDNGYCLPEGAYEFVFQAFDATKRNVPVSEPVYCYAYLSKMQPCRCLFPADNECVNYDRPSITFVWMEPTAALPTANKYYDLEIFEMPESFEGTTGEADAIVMSTSPIYKEEKLSGNQTMHLVPQSAGLFIKGRSYAWRVRTHFGTEPYTGNDPYKPSDYIENRGYSKLSIFHFKKCAQENVWAKEEGNEVKTNLTLKPTIEKVDTTDSKAVVVWKNELTNYPCGYEVEWNLVNALDSWERKIVGPGESRCELEKLKQGVKYVTRVRGLICSKRNPADTIRSAYSDTLHFQLDKNDATPCGRKIDNIDNFISLKELTPGSWITANGHDIKVLDCTPNFSGNDTTFSGHGLVSYGFLTNLVSLKVQFDNVKINENRELMQGVISSVTDKDNSLDFNLNGLANKNSAGTGPAPMQETFGFSESVASGSVGILKTEGKTEVVAKNEKDEPTTIGEMMVNEKGDFSCVQNNPYLDDNVGSVTFSPQEDRNTPFDYEQGVFRKSLSISDYYDELGSPWIAVPAGESTTIKATLKLKSGSPVKPEDVYFICRTKKETIKLNAKENQDGSFSIPIFGGSATNYLEVLAVADTSKDKKADCSQLFTLGRAKVMAMKKETYTLHIVPFRRDKDDVNGTSIENTLNEIYKPLGKTFTVEVEERFGDGSNYDFVEDGLIVEGSGFMTTETSEMSLLKALYSDSHELKTERDHAYMFLLPKSATAGVLGDMPRNKRVGYLFADYSTSYYNDGYAVAHEVGHGIFTFDHSFEYCDEEYFGKTSNLMDYVDVYTDPDLKVWQWNLMDTHPNYVLPFLEDDEDSELAAQIAQCLTAAAVDVAFNYAFKWVELWYDGTPVDITDYENIFGSMNKSEVILSALASCGSSFIPISTQKGKLVTVLAASFGAGATAMAEEMEKQYDAIHLRNPNLSTLNILGEIEWQTVLERGGTQSMIAGVATGAVIYGATHPKFINFASKLQDMGYEALASRLEKAGLSKNSIDEFCRKFGVKINSDIFKTFKKDFGISAIKEVDNIPLLNKIRSKQGVGDYLGIDDWIIVRIPKGTKIYGGLPGRTEFYSIEKSLRDVGYDMKKYWQSLQVKEDKNFGYRTKVGEFELLDDLEVGIAQTLNNPQFGVGGAWQIFVEDFTKVLKLIREIDLIK